MYCGQFYGNMLLRFIAIPNHPVGQFFHVQPRVILVARLLLAFTCLVIQAIEIPKTISIKDVINRLTANTAKETVAGAKAFVGAGLATMCAREYRWIGYFIG